MGDVHFRLGICDCSTYIDHGLAYGPWVSLFAGIAEKRDERVCDPEHWKCNSGAMLQSLALNAQTSLSTP
jgi:hypothetical protein